MTRPDIKATLAQMVSWSAITAVGKRTPSGVPAIVCDYFYAKDGQMPDVPVMIEAVVTAPVFAGDGTLITTPGNNTPGRPRLAAAGGQHVAAAGQLQAVTG